MGKRTILTDSRYPWFAVKYRYSILRFAVEVAGMEPTYQQAEVVESVEKPGSQTSVSSGHGTGKSHFTAVIVWAFLICFPESQVMLTANNIAQVQNVMFKYMKKVWFEIVKRFPWIEQYFVVTETTIYAKGYKGIWHVFVKSCNPGNEESLAGEHAKHYLIICDEASGISDKAMGVIRGAMTQGDNRILLLSQPTRNVGHFYASHHKLAKRGPNCTKGVYNAITLNSELSPLVTLDFIRTKLLEYGGEDSPEYQIKVRGQFPKTLAGYLLTRDACERAQRTKLEWEGLDYGFVMLVDVGGGGERDSTVINIMKVHGRREEMQAEPVYIKESNTLDELKVVPEIINLVRSGRWPNITVAVDADGLGRSTCSLLEGQNIHVVRIRWGFPMHAKDDKDRFINKRAFGNVMMKFAVENGRIKIDRDDKTIEQAVKIPYRLDEKGRWVMRSKEWMRDHGIPSPDRWDTYCFLPLVDYIPATETLAEESEAIEEALAEILGDDV